MERQMKSVKNQVKNIYDAQCWNCRRSNGIVKIAGYFPFCSRCAVNLREKPSWAEEEHYFALKFGNGTITMIKEETKEQHDKGVQKLESYIDSLVEKKHLATLKRIARIGSRKLPVLTLLQTSKYT